MAFQYSKSHLFQFLLSLYLLLSLSTPTALSISSNPPSVHDLLAKYGLPSGLLPSSVTDYTLNEDGTFVVQLEKECYIQFEYLVYYAKEITGKLGIGSISDLKGIQVKRFFLWLNVDEIKVDLPPSDSIYFQVGIINKKLDADQFKEVRNCRDQVSGSCGRFWNRVLELSAPSDVEMLITE